MPDFFEEGTRRAYALGNRGPLSWAADGELDRQFLDAYWRCGFYIFEKVLDAEEMAALVAEFEWLLSRAPVGKNAHTDANGDLALGADLELPCFRFARPLSDPFGGTDLVDGRFEVHMTEPEAPMDAPDEVLLRVSGILQFMDSALRLYGHPGLLRVAEAVNGPDFTPFTSGIWIKQPGLGPAVSWHQDGTTHWDSPQLDAGTHGFNFMTNLFPTQAGNALWVVPGTHTRGKLDITQMVEEGSDRIADAVPLLCQPGDVIICNRQIVHGSFANTSSALRATLGFGFHRLASVLGIQGWADKPYDEEFIMKRSRVVQLAIDARRQYYPDEPGYTYQPLADQADELRLNDDTRERILRNYNLLDIGI